MYEAGCWALPFFVCACVLLSDAMLQLLFVGRRASGELAATGKKAPPLSILRKLTIPAGMKVVFDAVAWIHMAGFEVTLQPFFGGAPAPSTSPFAVPDRIAAHRHARAFFGRLTSAWEAACGLRASAAAPYDQTPGEIGNLLLCVTLVNSIAYVAAPPFAVGVGATYVMPIAAAVCFGLSMLVGPSPLLTQIPQTMGVQVRSARTLTHPLCSCASECVRSPLERQPHGESSCTWCASMELHRCPSDAVGVCVSCRSTVRGVPAPSSSRSTFHAALSSGRVLSRRWASRQRRLPACSVRSRCSPPPSVASRALCCSRRLATRSVTRGSTRSTPSPSS